MSKVINKVIIEKFIRKIPIESHHSKTKHHQSMNQQVLDYFKDYATSLTDKGEGETKFQYLTITFNEKILRSLKAHNRSAFIQRVYEQLWWRMHTKLNIKRPLTTKTHQHLLMRQYQVIEDVNRYGNKTLEHLHIINGVHPKFHHKMNDKLYWESVVNMPNGFIFEEENRGFDYQDTVKELHIVEIPVHLGQKERWSDLAYTIDYTNKGLSKIDQGVLITGEIFNCFSPHTPTTITITKENTYGTEQLNRYG
jgi:DNA primase catalytic subunit